MTGRNAPTVDMTTKIGRQGLTARLRRQEMERESLSWGMGSGSAASVLVEPLKRDRASR